MNKVNKILSRKAGVIASIQPTTTVFDALKTMADKNIGSLIVLDASGKFLGIVTERDYSRKVVLRGKSSTDTLVQDIMSTDFPKVTPHDTVDHCMQLMTENNIRYLPVFGANELQGIISMSDVVKETIVMQQETINHLKEYISL
jgi:CBS domain-containing protein